MNQDDFRRLLGTAGSQSSKGPGSTAKDGAAASAKPKKDRSRFFKSKPKLKDGPDGSEKEKGSSADYRDRAAERRDVLDKADREAEEALLERMDYEKSKFLGGDLAHTHLVKGLDFALLRKIREEIADEEDAVLEQAIVTSTGTASSGGAAQAGATATSSTLRAPVGPQSTTAFGASVVAAAQAANKMYLPPRASKASAAGVVTPLMVSRAQEGKALCGDDSFMPGRRAYEITMQANAELDDIPTAILHSREDIGAQDVCTIDPGVDGALLDRMRALFGGAPHKRRKATVGGSGGGGDDGAAAVKVAQMQPGAAPAVAVKAPLAAKRALLSFGGGENDDDDDDIFGGVGKYDAAAIAAASSGRAGTGGGAPGEVGGGVPLDEHAVRAFTAIPALAGGYTSQGSSSAGVSVPLAPTATGTSSNVNEHADENGMVGSYPSSEVVGPYPSSDVVGPYPSSEVVGPYPSSDVVGPYPSSEVVGPYLSSEVVGPYPSSEVVGPYPSSEVVGPYLSSQVVGPYPSSEVVGPHPGTNYGKPGNSMREVRDSTSIVPPAPVSSVSSSHPRPPPASTAGSRVGGGVGARAIQPPPPSSSSQQLVSGSYEDIFPPSTTTLGAVVYDEYNNEGEGEGGGDGSDEETALRRSREMHAVRQRGGEAADLHITPQLVGAGKGKKPDTGAGVAGSGGSVEFAGFRAGGGKGDTKFKPAGVGTAPGGSDIGTGDNRGVAATTAGHKRPRPSATLAGAPTHDAGGSKAPAASGAAVVNKYALLGGDVAPALPIKHTSSSGTGTGTGTGGGTRGASTAADYERKSKSSGGSWLAALTEGGEESGADRARKRSKVDGQLKAIEALMEERRSGKAAPIAGFGAAGEGVGK